MFVNRHQQLCQWTLTSWRTNLILLNSSYLVSVTYAAMSMKLLEKQLPHKTDSSYPPRETPATPVTDSQPQRSRIDPKVYRTDTKYDQGHHPLAPFLHASNPPSKVRRNNLEIQSPQLCHSVYYPPKSRVQSPNGKGQEQLLLYFICEKVYGFRKRKISAVFSTLRVWELNQPNSNQPTRLALGLSSQTSLSLVVFLQCGQQKPDRPNLMWFKGSA